MIERVSERERGFSRASERGLRRRREARKPKVARRNRAEYRAAGVAMLSRKEVAEERESGTSVATSAVEEPARTEARTEPRSIPKKDPFLPNPANLPPLRKNSSPESSKNSRNRTLQKNNFKRFLWVPVVAPFLFA